MKTVLVEITSQSPENGSRLCKAFVGSDGSAHTQKGSQSPENGSRLCKGSCWPMSNGARLL
jgi:hypothetical protein